MTKLRYLYRAYRYRYRVDAAELRFLRANLRPGQVAVDIGCHKGAYTYWMRRRVGASGQVFAFEPQPRQVAYLRTVFASLPFENVVLVPMGVSDRVGKALLHIPSGAGQTHAASLEEIHVAATLRDADAILDANIIRDADARRDPNASFGETRLRGATSCEASFSLHEVDITTLDAFFADRPRGPNFLKIDVEGHELAVLHGGREVLAKYKPTLLVECEGRHRPEGDVRPVFDFLRSLGYVGMFFQNGIRRTLAEFDPAIHQRTCAESDRLPRGYVNNFAFIPGV
jgi:FkbM family methyltransferase